MFFGGTTIKLNRSHIADLRGAARMTTDAAASVTEVVENMHGTIQRLPLPLGRGAAARARGLSGFVYRCVRGGIQLVGPDVDPGLAGVATVLPEGESSPALDAYRSAANGVYGDYLVRTANPLAIDMSLRSRGRGDVRSVATVFGGGGHVNAAGCTVEGELAQVEATVTSAVAAALGCTG